MEELKFLQTPRQRRTALFTGGLIVVTTLLSVAFFLSENVLSENGAKNARELRVGLYQNEPKIYTGGEGKPQGLFVELLASIAEREGWRIHYVPCVWAQCLALLGRGELDLMPDVALSERRQARLDYHTLPVVQAWSQIYRSPEIHANSFEQLAGLRIAVLEGSVQQAFLHRMSAEKQLDYQLVGMESMQDAMASVTGDRADAAATNNFFGRRHAGGHQLIETPITFDQTSLYFATGEGKNATVLATVDRYLRQWKSTPDSPYYAALRSTLTTPARTPGWIVPVISTATALIAILSGLAYLLRWRVTVRTRELDQAKQHLQHLLDSSPVILYSLRGPELQLDWVSGNIGRILAFDPAAALHPGWWPQHLHPEDRRWVERENAKIGETGHLVQEYRMFDAYGKVRHIRDEKRYLAPMQASDETRVIGSWTDMTSSYEQREKVRLLAHYDSHTGLPNRSLLQDRLDHALIRARRENRSLLVVLIDLDRFKGVNETLGMAAGDQVLRITAQRLIDLIAPSDTAARVGSDEFCLIVEHDARQDAHRMLLDTLVETLHQPLTIAGHSLVLAASVGMAAFPGDGASREELIAAAELAMEQSKHSGGDTWRAYEPGLTERSSHRLFLERDLRQAIQKDEFVLHFQPQYHLEDGKLSGVEALVRWQQPERGLVPPGEFIPLAEETGLIQQIDRWVLNQACRQMALWDRDGHHVPRISVNLSANEFRHEELVRSIDQLLKEYQLQPGRLEVEITETVLMEFPQRALKILRQLDSLGVNLSMDDFGTGYSNLAYLHRLPLHQLKIDQSFVHEIEHSHHNRSIIRAIIALARALELQLVAEGIENDCQRRFLLREGCAIGQGFLLGRPAVADRLFALSSEERAVPGPG